MLQLFQAARKVSVPIVIIRTADQTATVEALAETLKLGPVLQWDAARGMAGVNDQGKAAARKMAITPDGTSGFVEAMLRANELPQGAVLFAHNAHRQLQSAEPIATAAAIQAVANLRGAFEANFRMLVLLCPGMTVPTELDQDVVVLDDPLPGPDALKGIVTGIYDDAKQKHPEAATLTKAVEALGGLSVFAARQVTAMSFTAQGANLPAMWERKRTQIEQTPGLKVYRGKDRFDDVVGLASVKARLRQRIKGRTPIGCVLMLDEVDKVLANVEHDTSGVRMDQLRTLLTEMEDNEWEGALLAGIPGGGKSLLAKALGNEAGVPTISLDLAAMEGSLVGESEARLRQAIAVVKAIGGGHAYIVATSNNATVMRPELQRRMTGGFFFFELMTADEIAAAWAYYMKRYDLPKQKLPDSHGWTAAEIRNCSREAWNSSVPLVEAAQFIVPVSQARADEFEEMRKYANGRYLDASKPGVYRYTPEPMRRQVRALDLGDVVTAATLAGMDLPRQ